jgi:hypothetical protein
MGTNRKPRDYQDDGRRFEAMRLHQHTYATSRPCRHHPDAHRYVTGRVCVECTRAYSRRKQLRRDLGDLW